MTTVTPPRQRHGTNRLSEVARHLVAPTGIVKTYWNAVRDQCVDLGLAFDRWQDGAGRLILSQRQNGRFAAGIGGVHLSWPRQVGKTYLIGAIVIALCLLRPGMLALWTAHHGKTINETFRAMQAMANRSKVAPHVLKVVTGNGDEGIEFRNGSRILFGAREHGFGLGFSKVSLLVFDEAQRLTQRAITDMVPTTNAGDNPLVFYVGTPPRPEDRGEVFVSRRKKALDVEAQRASGDEPRYNALYIELSADRTIAPDVLDWSQVAKANPSYPHRVDADAVERMWEQLGSEDFWREGYGIWDDHGVKLWQVVGERHWVNCEIPPTSAPTDGTLVFAVKFSADGERVSCAVALRPDEGPVHVESFGVVSMAEGTAGLVSWLSERWRKASKIFLDGKAGTGDLVQQLVAAGVSRRRLHVVSTDEAITAHAGMLRAIQEADVTHLAQPGLDAQVRVAGKRKIGNAGGWGWQAVTPDGDVTALDAVTLARHAAMTSKRRGGEGRTSSGNRTTSSGRVGVVM